MSEKKKSTKAPGTSPAPRLRTYRSVEYMIHEDGEGHYLWTRGKVTGTECATRDDAEQDAEAAIHETV